MVWTVSYKQTNRDLEEATACVTHCIASMQYDQGSLNIAWPSAEIAVMGPEGACNIIFKNEIQAAENSDAKRKELIEVYRDTFANPYVAASKGFIDDVVEPRQTRRLLHQALCVNANKRKSLQKRKHGNIPL